jgi:hypothetical protein
VSTENDQTDEIMVSLINHARRGEQDPPTAADNVMDLDELQRIIREWLIERASRPGVAL